MKSIQIILLILFAMFIQGCTVFSLHPLYEMDDLIFDDSLLGKWVDTEDEDIFVIIENLDDIMYKFLFCEVQKHAPLQVDTGFYEAGLLMLDKHLFFDLYPYMENTFPFGPDEADYLLKNFIPVHSFLKIKYEEDKLIFYMFDGDRMKDLFEQNRIRIKHEMMEDWIVITASTPDLQKFIRKYSNDEKAFDDPGIFERIR